MGSPPRRYQVHRRERALEIMRDVGSFCQVGERPLRTYQAECARAVARSVIERKGHTFTIMFARQMGKNETSAQLEAYLLALYAHRGGDIVKAAPSFKPQIINSILRLKDTLDASPLTRRRWEPAFGYMVRLGRASVTFLSADRSANVVGATASLLLEIDEAQDVDPDKYDREFRPMASSTNATTVLYGTAWSEDSILKRQRRLNIEAELRSSPERSPPEDRLRLHFEYDWSVLAAINPAYDAFVRTEMSRLGREHPSVQTQYLLRCLGDAGKLFSDAQRAALRGDHDRASLPSGRSSVAYVAGIDVAGEDEQSEDAGARQLHPRRDSTVITIAEVEQAAGQTAARIVEHIWWTGRDQVWQYERLVEIWRQWTLSRVCVDASGIGAGLAAFLEARFPDRVDRLVFTAPSKSELAYRMLAMINTGRLSVYTSDGSAEEREFWREIFACRYWLRANETMAWAVPESEGHDDFVTSLALTCRAAERMSPVAAGGLVRSVDDREGGW